MTTTRSSPPTTADALVGVCALRTWNCQVPRHNRNHVVLPGGPATAHAEFASARRKLIYRPISHPESTIINWKFRPPICKHQGQETKPKEPNRRMKPKSTIRPLRAVSAGGCLLAAATTAHAQNYWVGNTSTDWGVAANWSVGIPGNTSNANFHSTSYPNPNFQPVLSGANSTLTVGGTNTFVTLTGLSFGGGGANNPVAGTSVVVIPETSGALLGGLGLLTLLHRRRA
ncbi:MAG: hypothetical protein MUF04_06350 [Akkermansiaceae bacterium]|nr:hypothetical protein [Akkermansiaceae bacterium]